MEDVFKDYELFETIRDKMTLNYEIAECLVPGELKKEFRNRIFPKKYIQELLPSLVKCKKMEVTSLQDQIKYILAARIGIKGFGLRCEQRGTLPEEIYAELIRDLFYEQPVE